MRALILNSEAMKKIEAAVERARAKPISIDVIKKLAMPLGNVKLADRPPESFVRPLSEMVLLDVGYRCHISFEDQPAGLIRHLSISVDKKGMLPSIEASQMIAEAFGFKGKIRSGLMRFWLEEFEPDHQAINLVQLVESTEASNGS